MFVGEGTAHARFYRENVRVRVRRDEWTSLHTLWALLSRWTHFASRVLAPIVQQNVFVPENRISVGCVGVETRRNEYRFTHHCCVCRTRGSFTPLDEQVPDSGRDAMDIVSEQTSPRNRNSSRHLNGIRFTGFFRLP